MQEANRISYLAGVPKWVDSFPTGLTNQDGLVFINVKATTTNLDTRLMRLSLSKDFLIGARVIKQVGCLIVICCYAGLRLLFTDFPR